MKWQKERFDYNFNFTGPSDDENNFVGAESQYYIIFLCEGLFL